MKKLTAGIFATILGLTAMGAADAAVTSKGYVDSAVATAKAAAIADAEKYIDADELAASQAAQNTTIAGTYVAQTSYNTDKTALEQSIAGVKATADAAATKTALSEGLAGKQDLLQGTMFTKDGTGNVVTGITATNGQVTYTTANVATSEELTNLSGRVTTAEGKITTAEGDIATIKGQQTTQDNKISSLEAASATHATKAELGALQTNVDGVSSVASEAAANATQALADAATAQGAAEAAKQAADAAQLTANTNTQTIEGLDNTYVKIADYNEHVAAQEQTNTQVNTSLNSLNTNKADKTDLNSLATKTELSAKADQSALTAEATARSEADADLQEAINAVGGGVEAITGATNGTDTGLYALTKIVADDGTVSYGWELIDREYAAADVTDNGK